jgi:hypothetical protein
MTDELIEAVTPSQYLGTIGADNENSEVKKLLRKSLKIKNFIFYLRSTLLVTVREKYLYTRKLARSD